MSRGGGKENLGERNGSFVVDGIIPQFKIFEGLIGSESKTQSLRPLFSQFISIDIQTRLSFRQFLFPSPSFSFLSTFADSKREKRRKMTKREEKTNEGVVELNTRGDSAGSGGSEKIPFEVKLFERGGMMFVSQN